MNVACVPIIVVICYVAGEIYKLLFKKVKSSKRLIPVVTLVTGGLLALLIYFTVPDIIQTENAYEALVIGFVSGAGSTGANEIIKQLFTKDK